MTTWSLVLDANAMKMLQDFQDERNALEADRDHWRDLCAAARKDHEVTLAALDAKIDICGDERIAKLRAMLKTNAEWWYELSDDDKGDACMEAMG